MKFERYDGSQEYGGRTEYCVQLAANPEAFATALTLEKLDEILYADSRAGSEEFSCSATGDSQVVTRTLSGAYGQHEQFIYGLEDGTLFAVDFTWPMTETRITLTHEIDKKLSRERYTIVVGWALHLAGGSLTPITTGYSIDKYPAGPVQAYMDYYSMETDLPEGRRMSSYDFADLYTQLDKIADMQKLGQQEDSYIVG